MAATIIYNCRSGDTNAGASTYYSPPGSYINVATSATSDSTEAVTKVLHRTAGSYARLFVLVVTNSVASTSTINGRKNAAAGTLTVSVGASTTGEFVDNTNRDDLASGDYYCWELTLAGAGSFRYQVSAQFTASNGSTVSLWNNLPNGVSAASTTFYIAASGGSVLQAVTEAFKQYQVQQAGTWQKLSMHVQLNARTTDSTFRNRINGADGAMAVTVAASTTGEFEDASNTNAVAAADLINLSLTTGTGTGSINARWMRSEYVYANPSLMQVGSCVSTQTVNASATAYFFPSGRLDQDATEANTAMDVPFAFRASKLQCYISANTIVGTSTLNLRKNAGAGGPSVSITGLTAGWFSDTSNTADFAKGDEWNLEIVGGAAGTSLSLASAGCVVDGFTGRPLINAGLMNRGLINAGLVN